MSSFLHWLCWTSRHVIWGDPRPASRTDKVPSLITAPHCLMMIFHLSVREEEENHSVCENATKWSSTVPFARG
jgi:hypothetical protein